VKKGERVFIGKTFYKMLLPPGVMLLIFGLFGVVSMQANAAQSPSLIAEGQQIFRYDTFGDEDF
jgi:hypothetical protein